LLTEIATAKVLIFLPVYKASQRHRACAAHISEKQTFRGRWMGSGRESDVRSVFKC